MVNIPKEWLEEFVEWSEEVFEDAC